jgi:arabinofuranan 3-O-arabinosyltransferase
VSGAASGAASAVSRAVTIRSWQPDQRRLSIGRGAASYLEVHENYNPGWAAALNGQRLTPVRLDGWQQGFLVPAGAGGMITLTFRPAATYHLALVASLFAAAILLAVAAWSFTGRRRGAGRDAGHRGAPPARNGPRWLSVLAVTALIFVAGGPLALAVPLLAVPLLAGRVRLPVLAFGAMVASGLLAAVRPFGTGLLGPFGWPAQACALVALAAALIAGSTGAPKTVGTPGNPGTSGTSGTVGEEDG